MSLVGVAVASLVFAALVGLALSDLLTWLTGRTAPDRYAWCQWLASGGTFRETRR